MGKPLRLRSVGNVLAEMDALEEKLGQRSTWFQDETFGANRRWTDEFLSALIARNRRKGWVFRWGGNSRANLAAAELYRVMKESGCYALSFGVESGNDEILRRIKKEITGAAAIRAIATAREAGIHSSAFFIIGHPGETWRTALQTVHLAAKCRADSIAVGVMVPYPGTEVWEMARAGEGNYRLLLEDWRFYDKYFGKALAIEGLTHRQLEFFQVLAYLWHYTYNLRFRKLMGFFWRFRLAAAAMARRLLGMEAAGTP
jgi:anaerobic magnesium-protoporphyrin IX monomethyl ester cyclase